MSVVRFVGAATPGTGEQRGIDAVRSSIGVPGLTAAALRTVLAQTAAPADLDAARQRAADLSDLLATAPLATREWLSLAETRLATAPVDAVAAALRMSSLTGPNEGALMFERALFAVAEWDLLPADARQRAGHDLAGIADGKALGDRATLVARSLLRAKSEKIRDQIAELLRAQGVAADGLDRLGL